MLRRRFIAAAMLGLAIAVPVPAYALDSGQAPIADHLPAEEARSFSKEIERELAARGAVVAMVFRTGRPREKLPEGTAYTHGAFWVYQSAVTPDGDIVKGYAVYNLYTGDGEELPLTQSRLVQDFPFDFTAASHEEDVAVIIPTREVQRRLLGVIASPDYEALHIPEYSLVSNPADARYQNCTEFMLDVLAAGLWETTDYAQLKVNLGAAFKPTRIKAGGLQRLFAPLADSRLRLADQGRTIETVTFESLSQFMQDYGYADEILRVDLGEGAVSFTLH